MKGLYFFFGVVFLLIVLLGKCFWDHLWLTVRVALADEQTLIFDDMRIQALQSDPVKAVDFLEYALNYYPSGTKQIEGSRLDRIVERARAGAVSAIINDLRKRSGKDFGEDPQRWIDQFKSGK